MPFSTEYSACAKLAMSISSENASFTAKFSELLQFMHQSLPHQSILHLPLLKLLPLKQPQLRLPLLKLKLLLPHQLELLQSQLPQLQLKQLPRLFQELPFLSPPLLPLPQLLHLHQSQSLHAVLTHLVMLEESVLATMVSDNMTEFAQDALPEPFGAHPLQDASSFVVKTQPIPLLSVDASVSQASVFSRTDARDALTTTSSLKGSV